jgi:hypothetical protein
MASGTDGNLITYDASGNPAAVATGNAGQILTSAGTGAPPTFATASGSFVATANADLTFVGDHDIIDLQRIMFEVQGTGYTLNATHNENSGNNSEQQMFVRTIDANNEGLFIRLKKNGASSYEEVQIA